jgi:hypothetical protein
LKMNLKTAFQIGEFGLKMINEYVKDEKEK